MQCYNYKTSVKSILEACSEREANVYLSEPTIDRKRNIYNFARVEV